MASFQKPGRQNAGVAIGRCRLPNSNLECVKVANNSNRNWLKIPTVPVKWAWYLKAQSGILLLPMGLCLFGEAVMRRSAFPAKPWFWLGTLSLICVNAGVGLMIESGLFRGHPRR